MDAEECNHIRGAYATNFFRCLFVGLSSQSLENSRVLFDFGISIVSKFCVNREDAKTFELSVDVLWWLGVRKHFAEAYDSRAFHKGQ